MRLIERVKDLNDKDLKSRLFKHSTAIFVNIYSR